MGRQLHRKPLEDKFSAHVNLSATQSIDLKGCHLAGSPFLFYFLMVLQVLSAYLRGVYLARRPLKKFTKSVAGDCRKNERGVILLGAPLKYSKLYFMSWWSATAKGAPTIPYYGAPIQRLPHHNFTNILKITVYMSVGFKNHYI